MARILVSVAVIPMLLACQPGSTSDAELVEEAEALNRESEAQTAELEAIVSDVVDWRDRYGLEDGADEILLSLLSRRLSLHPMAPTDSTEAGREFQEIERRVRAHRRAEIDLVDRVTDLGGRLQRRFAANPGALGDTTMISRGSLTALPFRTCPFEDGCRDRPGPLAPCLLFSLTIKPGQLCVLIDEDCKPTAPLGSGGWLQQCRYTCGPILIDPL